MVMPQSKKQIKLRNADIFAYNYKHGANYRKVGAFVELFKGAYVVVTIAYWFGELEIGIYKR